MPVGLIRGYTRHLTPVSPGAARTDPLDRGLVGEWRFDPVTGLMLPDYSGLGNHGTLLGPTWTSSEIGPVLYFDGVTDYVNILDAPSLDVSSVSIEVYFSTPIALTDQKDWGGLVAKDDIGAQPEYSVLVGNGNFIRFSCRNGAGAEIDADTTSAFSIDTFYHIVGTYSSIDGLRIYKDAIQEGTDAANGILRVSVEDLRIGTFGTNEFRGEIGLVRLYDRVLSAAEVRARYEICLKRAQPMTHVWMMPFGYYAAAVRVPRYGFVNYQVPGIV